jgi:predicted secreted protein
MLDVKEPSNVTSKRSGWRFAKLAIYLLVAYLVGFFVLGLGYRSENDNVRLATAIIDGNIYRPLIDLVKDTVPGIRSAVVLRFRIFCVGADHRCRVTYD